MDKPVRLTILPDLETLSMSRQLEELLRRRDRLEVSKLLGPLASRLDRIGGELRTTGQVFNWDQLSKKLSL